MISRRNIRVKVMQTLYTLSTLEENASNEKAQKLLQQHLDETRSLTVFLTWFLTELLRYTEKYAHAKASKHLPTAEDLSINTKLAGNSLLWQILEDKNYVEQCKNVKPEKWEDGELIKKIYLTLIETETYKAYIQKENRDKTEERKIIEFVLNDMMLANEEFVSVIEERFSNWDDDGEGIIQLIAGYLHKPGSFNFGQPISADKVEFAKELLKAVLEKKEHLETIIVPKLKNWDPERIALIDMLMMKMGVAEFLYFETIPPKVTINEYIDLAKDYSTAQSGQFVNGILDNIHKELVAQGKMDKVEFKKSNS
jgi:N utilization substance protein B